MTHTKMHDHEIAVDLLLVKSLLSEQFPQWSALPVERVQSDGTDNAIFRLGEELCLRLPRIPEVVSQIEKEQKWLPVLASHLPLAIPFPLAKGQPHSSYPLPWSIYRWLEGKNAAVEPIADLQKAALQLAAFITALHKIDATGGPPSHRGIPLISQDKEVQVAIKQLSHSIDVKKVTTIWETCLAAKAWGRAPVWTHGDLLPGNLLVQEGKLSAVIDFGLFGIGDPACDLIAAWSIFTSKTRPIFREALKVDEDTWLRGCGWALSVGLIILPYYEHTNPGLVAVGKRLIKEVLADFSNNI